MKPVEAPPTVQDESAPDPEPQVPPRKEALRRLEPLSILANAPPKAPEEPPHRQRSLGWLPVIIALGAVALGVWMHELWTLAREPRWVELHLDAKPADGHLAVTWDAAAARVAGANKALLAVNEGNSSREIELSPAQLRFGRFDYLPVQSPPHSDVAFRLTIYADGVGVSGDAVHVAAPTDSKAVAAAVAPTTAAPTPASPTAPAASLPPQVVSAEPVREAIAPVTVHEVQPGVSEGIRSRIREQIVIPVRVHVTERGRVSQAAVERKELDGLRRYLADLAEKAARQWRFTPAKSQQGIAVESTKTINFIFTP